MELSGIHKLCAEAVIFDVSSNLIAYESKNGQKYLPGRQGF
jgi:hypothetical protein